MYYIEFEEHVVLGTSPESLIQVKGERVIATPTEEHIREEKQK